MQMLYKDDQLQINYWSVNVFFLASDFDTYQTILKYQRPASGKEDIVVH